LRVVFNDMMRNNWFPDEWKVARLTPIFKKGSKTKVENYRPVSGLCTLSKVFERCILDRLDKFALDDHVQHGFRKGHGTVTAGLELQHHISSALDQKKQTIVYSADMSEAFDLIRPELLDVSQFPKELAAMIVNFLTDRSVFVEVDGERSESKPLRAGVPQGSVLGPKLFSLYTKNLKEVIQKDGVELIVYADDSFVVCSARTEEEAVKLANSTLGQHLAWLKSVGMVVNPKKTEVMFMKTDKKISLCYEGNEIESTHQMRVLGVWFDHKLEWSYHVARVKRSCRSLIPALRMLRKKLKDAELSQVITSHYYSRLYYGSEIWFNCLNFRLKKSISSIHFFPQRLLVRDYKNCLSKKRLSELTKRAPPSEYNNFKLAKILILICNNCEPFSLFHELISSSTTEQRKPYQPRFFDSSRSKVGRQSLPNRVTHVANQLTFDWLPNLMSKDLTRIKLKEKFFTHH